MSRAGAQVPDARIAMSLAIAQMVDCCGIFFLASNAEPCGPGKQKN